MSRREEELKVFEAALLECLKPIGKEFGVALLRISPELFILEHSKFAIKFYCAPSHGYSFTVTVSPKASREWNAKEEVGFSWLSKHLNLPVLANERYSDAQSFRESISSFCSALPEYVRFLKNMDSTVWAKLSASVRSEK